MLQREVPIWLAVVAIVVFILVIAGIYWMRQPRIRESTPPPPEAPFYKAGPGLGGEKPVELGKPSSK